MLSQQLKTESIDIEVPVIEKVVTPNQFLFPAGFKLLPNVTEIFELELAFYEYSVLNKEELIQRSAYFEKIDGQETAHFKLCKEPSASLWENRSASTAAYFRNGLFSTGYATHGLFPYRGKFHPQLVKSLLNIIGLKDNELVLDPMCGSGTLNVEASLIGINSMGVDKNPFACFMSKVKLDALNLDLGQLEERAKNQSNIIQRFLSTNKIRKNLLESNKEEDKIERLFLLAFLDAMGYSRRTQKSIEQLFPIVLNRYIGQVKQFLLISEKLGINPAKSQINFGDARELSFIKENSVDGIITSPPYSFAIDYVENDKPQIEFLNYDVQKLKEKMIGLHGKGLKEKLDGYFSDMDKVLSEFSRVLKSNKYAIIIIGSNDIQTKGVRLENKIKEFAPKNNLVLVKEIRKPIIGLRNTMKDEFILILKKVK